MLNSNTIFILKYRTAKEKIEKFSSSFIGKLGGGIKSRQSIRKYNILNILIRFLQNVSSDTILFQAKEPTPITITDITLHSDFSLLGTSGQLFNTQNKNLSIVLKVLLPTGQKEIVSVVTQKQVHSLLLQSLNYFVSGGPQFSISVFKNLVLTALQNNSTKHFSISVQSNSTGLTIRAPKTAKYNGSRILSNRHNDSAPMMSFNSSSNFEFGVSKDNVSNNSLFTIVNLNSIFDKIAIVLKFKYKKAVKYQSILNSSDSEAEEILQEDSMGLVVNSSTILLDSNGDALNLNGNNNQIQNSNGERKNY